MTTYLEKEIANTKKLEAAGYEAFGGSRDEALGFMEKHLGAIAAYAAAIGTRHMRAGNEDGNPHGRDMAGNRHLETALDDAAAAIDALGRLSASLGLEPFADIDASDRQAVVGVAADFASEMFRTGTRGEA